MSNNSTLIFKDKPTVDLISINMIDPAIRTQSLIDWEQNKFLSEYLEGFNATDNLVVSISGRVIRDDFNTVRLLPFESIVVAIVPAGGDGDSKGIFRLILTVALAYFAGPLAGSIMGVGTTGAAVLAAGMTIAGSMLINALLPPPNIDNKNSSLEDSPNYGIDGAKNTSQEGLVIPVLYGTFRLGGNLIAVHNENVGDDQYLYLLFGVAERTLASMAEIEINDQPLITDGEPTYDNLEVKTYLQGGIPEWFGKIISPINLSRVFEDTYDYHTTVNDIDQFRFDIVLPAGLFGIDDEDGESYPVTVGFKIEYRKVGTTEWKSVPAEVASLYKELVKIGDVVYEYPEALPAGYYYFSEIEDYINGDPGGQRVVDGLDASNSSGRISVQKERMSYDASSELDDYATETYIQLSPDGAGSVSSEYMANNIRGRDWGGITAGSVFTFGTYDSIESDYIDDMHGTDGTGNDLYARSNVPGDVLKFHSSPSSSTLTTEIWQGDNGFLAMTANARSAIRRSLFSPVVPRGKYEIRYLRTPESLSDQESDAMSVTDINEITSGSHSYDIAMLAIKLKVSDEFNSLPKVTALCRSGISNPASVCYDMMTNKVYGAGMSSAKIDKFKITDDWKRYCLVQGFQFNGVFDSQSSLWDQLGVVSRIGHGRITNLGTKFSVALERVDNPVMMFNVSNIVKSSFSLNWLSLSDRANRVELSFRDREDNYRKNTFTHESISAGDVARSVTVDMQGITDVNTAEKEAVFMLNLNKYILQTCSFEVPVESIGCAVGDQVVVQHDMPQWGYGGNVRADSAYTSVMLDREVEMFAGKTYKALFLIDKVKQHTGSCSYEGGIDSAWKTISGFDVSLLTLSGSARLVVGANEYTIEEFGTNAVRIKEIVSIVGQTCDIYSTDIILEQGVILNVGKHTEIELSNMLHVDAFNIPLHTRFMFGEYNKIKKPFRVVAISGKDADSRKLTCLEYNTSVYDFNTPVVPTLNYSYLKARGLPIIDSANIDIQKSIYLDSSTFKNKINVQFTRPTYNTELSIFVNGYEINAYKKRADGTGAESAGTIFVPKKEMESIISKDFLDVAGGTYVVRIRSVASVGSIYENSPWSNALEVTVEDVHDYLSIIGLPDPINPKLFATVDTATSTVDKIRIESGYDTDGTEFPAGSATFLMFYSSFDLPNQVLIDQDNGDNLRIKFEEDDFIAYSAPDTELTVLPLSSDNKLVVKNSWEPFVVGVDLADRWWVQMYDPNNPTTVLSEWRMVTSYDETALYFGEANDLESNLDINPQAGYKIRYVQFAWTDQRTDEFKLAYIENTIGDHEIIKWGGVEQIGNSFYITDCLRAQEGTTQINAAYNKISYYPAPGKDTMIAAIPIQEFGRIDVKKYEAVSTQNISVVPNTYMSISCCVAIEVDKSRFYRSNIVPLTYKGNL